MAAASARQNPRSRRGFCFVLLMLCCATAAAQAYRPDRDDEVLAELPARTAPAALVRARDAALAARAAQVFIERGRRSGDPRDHGYAQGLLQPWWSTPDAPDAVLLLRATLRQHRHEFDAALTDLDRFLARSPGNAQALLTRATLHRVRGALDRSLQDCDQLQVAAPGVAAGLCRLAVEAQRDPATALAALERLDAAMQAQPDEVLAWYHAELGAAAERLGDSDRAEGAYRAGLVRAPWDAALRAALADLLIAQNRAHEVLPLIEAAPASEPLRLRELLARRAIGNARGEALADSLAEAYDATRRRGDTPHLRDEAMFELYGRGDAARALTLAQANWRDQRELADARLLLAAALAVGEREVVEELRSWCARERVRDVWLERRW
jgi:hypothetical protein